MREYSNNEQWWMNDSVLRETKKYDIFLWETKYVRAKLEFGRIVMFSEKLGVEHICRTSCVWQGSIPVEMFHYWGK